MTWPETLCYFIIVQCLESIEECSTNDRRLKSVLQIALLYGIMFLYG